MTALSHTMPDAASSQCYHCGQPVPPRLGLYVQIETLQRAMCCRGCQAVAQAIVDNGLADYYRSRTAMPESGQEIVPAEIKKLALYDHPDIQRSFVIDAGPHCKEAVLILEGITCAACVWLNERHLKQLAGIQSVEVNYANHRARIAWDERQIELSRILQEIQLLGYNAHPYSAWQADQVRKTQRKKDLQRIAIAGIAAAQVMMLAVALYAGAWYGIDLNTRRLLRWFSLLLTLPVVSFAAWPFYRSAWSGLQSRHLNMDVPVSIAILSAFAGSLWTTFTGGTQVYYDTISMFTLFLLVTRLLESGAREKSIESAENLLKLQPAMATRIRDGQQDYIAVLDLQQGDHILAKAGEIIAADGVIVDGMSTVDESLLTGESRAVPKQTGDTVIAGSMNQEGPLVVQVTGIGENTVLAGIVRLVDKAQAEKPRIAQIADRVAVWFTLGLLIFALLTGLIWLKIDAGRAFEIVLSVLVVTCPCALSLAVPAALAAAGSNLIKRGILVTRGHALETLSRVTCVVFDKTGTLTVGKPRIEAIELLANVSAEWCAAVAAGLEQASEHPLAHAFMRYGATGRLPAVSNARNVPGHGVSGEISAVEYTLGNRKFASQGHDADELRIQRLYPAATLVWLCDAKQALAVFVLSDPLRADAKEAVAAIQARGLKVSILSGDSEAAVAYAAAELGISSYGSQQKPQDKLAFLQALQERKEMVAMVGDGINDAPVLAGAHVSFAMGTGTDVASQTSDIVLLSSKLVDVDAALAAGKSTLQVMHQNLWWAAIYNFIALPFAAMGYISPWLAALGMSLSSLIVVLNALRLR
ncbi:MAG: heavy metal translocating P-type ATPase [Burkholderiales bacterium]